ncbi:pyruvate:ferredoxin (flavodoxin) oxidoreductase [Candidatus Thiodiazotropha endoloripes]|uniref:pyruvate:ferredoxin (flavodoxin) oxidoreductase n=1 Tax=Candidatus Thiodiazotropha endoloripes TaxID=1818881 RepID=UPI00083D568F|nr:pyruvate:ferredoxin (flavodoxin) oxidoreductase [Candidatus Thiodiazotropha endoloripes]MCG7903354.1 pyruvate:ferredoxin (flavodoxin) oxidoreductase [Candidatus Thiodiazotropha weberae]ODB83693.1 pyruvate:ferredoxin (flavodoxin) oxidoreductase [Candidatus Thiodiazotropha endoloripes]ODB90720.1 pyruvate:ferredoxin (flavodoxin) oxidoreductase [Candidatus Thiodiazotropha endoloripes]
MSDKMVTIDGNEAAAHIAHMTNEVIAIYPITPASPMGEWSDEWSAKGVRNIWGSIPDVIEMQSEAGAAGAVHGALQAGSLSTSFTASQGLLLMIPNMFKIAGELTPTVLHVSARSLAAQALSIFGDHSDVMACRSTGYAMLCSASVQEVADFALIAQAATLETRIPFLHFFDGFRTSHELNKIALPDPSVIKAMIDNELVEAHRARSLSPDHPVIRGTSQNPDVYFQGRETVNPYYNQAGEKLQAAMARFGALTGRHYELFEYYGAAQPERLIILMGSGIGAAEICIDHLSAEGERIGMIKARLFRPFAADQLLKAIPESVQKIAVLDRTKEPGADGEPLYKDVLGAFAQAYSQGQRATLPRIVGGRYGLSSKEFTPAMVKGIFDELSQEQPKNGFTVGIMDDVTHTSLPWDADFRPFANADVSACVFYGLGADGTVSANKNSIKIIGEQTDNYTQGYFQYDSKKSGAVTVSHLRFGAKPINATYLIGDNEAGFVACHQPIFLGRYEMLEKAAPGATFLLNSQADPDQVWQTLPPQMQKQMIEKQLSFYVIDAYKIAAETGMGRRINTIMQTCFFSISGLLESDRAIDLIKAAVKKSYGRKGARLLQRNFDAIDTALAGLHKVDLPDVEIPEVPRQPIVPADAPEFVQQVTAPIIAGQGDSIPVSLMPADGTWPLGTTAYEKRNIALQLPKWEMDLCTHCGKCPLVCPHAAIRSKLFPASLTDMGPESFLHTQVKGGRDFAPDTHISYQVAPDDCTGCGLCVEICPIRDKQNPQRKALNMVDDPAYHEQERINWEFFVGLPEHDRTQLKQTTLKGAMVMQPLFEFSGACVGCGETPYIKLATQLFGDRMLIANATGCSSIYGGNLPTTPYTTNPEGRGPTWSNSLFEDNAEFGLGMRIAIDKQNDHAKALLQHLRKDLDQQLVEQLLNTQQQSEAEIFEQRERIETLKQACQQIDDPQAQSLISVADSLARKSVWLVGGDGWAYDIGYGGVDHVLASGRNVNILLLDTETYSNTGGQTSKATPLGAVAKFSAAGKPTNKKDIAMMAMAYGNVYVAQVAFGAKDVQTLRAFLEAEAYPGPSLLICYSPCIAHGVDLSNNIRQQELAVDSGHWPLFRYDPRRSDKGENPLKMDSKEPSIPYRDFASSETRFSVLQRTHPEASEKFLRQAQQQIKSRYRLYEQLAQLAMQKAEG